MTGGMIGGKRDESICAGMGDDNRISGGGVRFFEGIFPGGSMGKYLKYIFALIILSVILSPVAVIFG